MAIWRRAVTVGAGLDVPEGTVGATLGLRITEVGTDYLRGTLPVDARTRQRQGRLHGGASCVLAEELGGVAGQLCTELGSICVGVELNASHLRAAAEGDVTGTARPLRIGRSLQVWEIRIEDVDMRLVCIARLTLAVVAE